MELGLGWKAILMLGVAVSLFENSHAFVSHNSKQMVHPTLILESAKSSMDSTPKFNATSILPITDSLLETFQDVPTLNDVVFGDEDTDPSVFPSLLKLASMHCASQALNTAIKLKIPDLIGTQTLSVEELAKLIEASTGNGNDTFEQYTKSCQRDALFRTLRLLATIDIVREVQTPHPTGSLSMSSLDSFHFSLTPLGTSLRTTANRASMASCVLHWMEEPLWNSWLELSEYIREGGPELDEDSVLPFERANGGVSSDFWYNKEDHPESLQHANDFVRLIHDYELKAVVEGLDWSYYSNQRLVDVAGNNGKLAEAIAASEPTLDCSCLDLPSVIESVPSGQEPKNVKLVPGNVLDSDTIPDCEVILMKHFCDRCMWPDDQTIEILRCCKTALQRSEKNMPLSTIRRKIVIADAVLPDCGRINDSNELPLYLDALYMLVGRERQRTRSEWKALATAAGLSLSGVIDTGVPSCSLIVLEPKLELSP